MFVLHHFVILYIMIAPNPFYFYALIINVEYYTYLFHSRWVLDHYPRLFMGSTFRGKKSHPPRHRGIYFLILFSCNPIYFQGPIVRQPEGGNSPGSIHILAWRWLESLFLSCLLVFGCKLLGRMVPLA